jgi:hypothetical protein
MKVSRAVVAVAILVVAMTALPSTWPQEPQRVQPPVSLGRRQNVNNAAEAQNLKKIDFENLSPGGPGGGGWIPISTQYEPEKGVTFNDAMAIDYSKGNSSLPDFAHSGTRAIERCHGVEVACDPRFVMTFTRPQRWVKVWFGYSGRVPKRDEVVLTARISSGAVLTDLKPLGPSNGPVLIRTPLEVTSIVANIISAEVSLRANAVQFPGLALDDVEFSETPPLPDLMVRSQGSTQGPNQQVFIAALVENIGEVASPATVVEARSVLWNGPVKADVPALDPKKTAQVQLTATISEVRKPGEYAYTLVVNPDSTIIEADTDRKNDSTDDQIPLKPDLLVQIVDSGINNEGRPFVLAEVTNVGHAQSPVTEIQIKINMSGRAENGRVEALAPKEIFQVTMPISGELRPGEYPFDAEVNPKRTFLEEDFENNKKTAASLSIPRSSWWPPRPPWFFPVPEVLVIILLGTLGVKGIRRVRRPPTQITPTIPPIPTLVARPTLHPGKQSLELSDPNDGGSGLGLRLEMGAAALQIDEPGGPAQEDHRL